MANAPGRYSSITKIQKKTFGANAPAHLAQFVFEGGERLGYVISASRRSFWFLGVMLKRTPRGTGGIPFKEERVGTGSAAGEGRSLSIYIVVGGIGETYPTPPGTSCYFVSLRGTALSYTSYFVVHIFWVTWYTSDAVISWDVGPRFHGDFLWLFKKWI